MLKQILDSAGLDQKVSADLLGVSSKIFDEWVSGQRAIPDSMIVRLSTILGVSPTDLRSPRKLKGQQADIAPAIWYKLRGEGLVSADRECVLLIRQLGFYMNQLEEVTQKKPAGWKNLFESIRRETDIQAPPREQGRQAARIFRETTGLGKGCTGIGEVFRGYLRNHGILVIESPVPESSVEGCSFYIGSTSQDRPCLFANTHHNTWFRRNQVLIHELGHAIFDVPSVGASVDFAYDNSKPDLAEERAQAFSFEVMIPREVLRQVVNANGIRWDSVQAHELAILVAKTHMEKAAVTTAALECEFIDAQQANAYRSMDITSELKHETERALTTDEFLQKMAPDQPPWLGKRSTTIPTRILRLPTSYIESIVEAVRNGDISRGKAAELLMIQEDDFEERFGDVIKEEVA